MSGALPGKERQQIEWFVFDAALVPLWFLVNAPIDPEVASKAHVRTEKRMPPGVLCKRRGILYFAEGLARII